MSDQPAPRILPPGIVRTVLDAMRETARDAYDQVLRDAGLGRFAGVFPAELPTLTATTADISRLYGTFFRTLGDTPTKKFLANYGRRVGARVSQQPEWLAQRATLSGLGGQEQLQAAAEKVAAQITSTWTETKVEATAQGLLLVRPACHDCADMRGAQVTMCASAEQVYGAYLSVLLDRRVRCTEVECAALGGARCSFRIN